MSNMKTQLDRLSDLTWNDIEAWVGGKIISRGQKYQRQGRVADLAAMDDGSLIAEVIGSERYATRVFMGEDGLPESVCTCPYEGNCKHGVAVLLEYLKQVENDRNLPQSKADDERLTLLADEGWDDGLHDSADGGFGELGHDINDFLEGKTKAQLIALIHELAGQYPEVARELADRKQVISGNTETLVTRLRKEIRDLGSEPGWRNYWNSEGYTPDYSVVRKKLEMLLKEGHADEVLALGRELLTTGMRQVEESHDEGETAMEIADCMSVIVGALDRSSLDAADKLNWAVDAVQEDQFDLCQAFGEYLHRNHPPKAWGTLADRLLARLHRLKGAKGLDDLSRNHERDGLSNWTIHALEQAGRGKEILPLCIAEAKVTGSYERLVNRLMASGHVEDAEKRIKEGLQALGKKWPGIAANLRRSFGEIRTSEENWPVVAALQVEEFVYHPSRQAVTDCQKVSDEVQAWPAVREALMRYLETGELPWEQKGWPLPKSGLERPKVDQRLRFPLLGDLINIALLEEKPDQVLKWYDRLPKGHSGWPCFNEDTIATAVQAHAPERAVAIWKQKAERLIAQVKPGAYEEAGKFLGKAGKVMSQQDKQAQWDQYLGSLREAHARKRRLLEVLDGLEEKPIIKMKR